MLGQIHHPHSVGSEDPQDGVSRKDVARLQRHFGIVRRGPVGARDARPIDDHLAEQLRIDTELLGLGARRRAGAR